MSSKIKHKQRSRYRYHEYKPFSSFQQKALRVQMNEYTKKTFFERIKNMFKRTENK